MSYENKIYDITAVEMFKRLEVFLNKHPLDKWLPKGMSKKDKSKIAFNVKAHAFVKMLRSHEQNNKEIASLMEKISKTRNKIVHPSHQEKCGNFLIQSDVVIDSLDEFQTFRDDCIKLENLLNQFTSPARLNLGMDEIMIPTLKYQIGNLGDIIKHGLLAEFVEWWVETEMGKLVYADTFAGCPWGGVEHVFDRVDLLKDTALYRANPGCKSAQDVHRKYLGSTHLVKRICEKHPNDYKLLVCDKDKNARSNLRASGLTITKMPNDKDGYSILNGKTFAEHKPNLILLDPYGEFLLEESRNKCKRLCKIARLVDDNPNLWVALFVLDMYSENGSDNSSGVRKVHDNYVCFRDSYFANKAVYLHCPKARGPQHSKIKGEDKYDVEILLISKCLDNKEDDADIQALLERLEKFASQATKSFQDEEGLSLIGDGEVRYKKL